MHDQHQRPKAHKMHAFQVQAQAQAIFIVIKVQVHQASSILNGPRRSKWSNFASLHIWFATSWLSLKFVCLFHVSNFFFFQKFHVAFNELCLCVCVCIYIYIYIFKSQKKKNQDSQIFPKREENFQMKKVFGLRALGP